MTSIGSLIKTFTVSGATLSGIQYIGNKYGGALGGILSGVPISIPGMLLIKGLKKQEDFIWTASVMVGQLSVITFICWYLLAKLKWHPKNCVIATLILWVIGSLSYYFFFIKK